MALTANFTAFLGKFFPLGFGHFVLIKKSPRSYTYINFQTSFQLKEGTKTDIIEGNLGDIMQVALLCGRDEVKRLASGILATPS